MNPRTLPDSISTDDLKHALRSLYDPARLGKSPLAASLGIPPGDQAASGLRRKLVVTIQSLKPEGHIPQSSKAWRIYNVLTYRYIEQMSQKQVATDMGLVIRQLRRLEGAGLQALAGALAAQGAERAAQSLQMSNQKGSGENNLSAGERPAGTQQELDWLKQTTPCETIEIVPFVENILRTTTPLLEMLGVEVRFSSYPGLPPLCGQITSIRQALMSVLTALGQCVPGGRLTLSFQPGKGAVRLWAEVTPAAGKSPVGEEQLAEALGLAQRLLELSGGGIEPVERREGRGSLRLSLLLPAPGELLVLALDDNLDALRLAERFLVGSRYRLFPLQDPMKLVETAEALRPDIILLDVMLPGVDGWELLGRLREHPSLGSTPLIVSTILPQESLALALGAAAFLRKPVSQEPFLQALDRLAAGRKPG